ncbi:L-2-hydroxyglutarate oxidase [Micrococcoides hystricis]|uniref:L-2-hydroxyglutarate oxidase n=1 Tax=Micrococcoides hystricis TaxID=1572761 RepID=A0ABV6P8Q3_9MICC
MHQIEPHVRAVAGVHSPATAVTDFSAICEHLAAELRRAGSAVLLNAEVTNIRQHLGRVQLETTVGQYHFDRLIVCAGLFSDKVAAMVGASPDPRILPFRGEYWTLAPQRQQLVKSMIYPVPDPAFPFLGVHFTKGVYGDVHVGPNAVPALAREGYSWSKISVADTWESLRWPGVAPLVKKYWRTGATEIAASVLKPLYLRAARAYIPSLTMGDLQAKGPAGVRAQAWSKDGSLLDDFAIDSVGPVTLIRNAPSPAATSALAIAEYVTQQYFH